MQSIDVKNCQQLPKALSNCIGSFLGSNSHDEDTWERSRDLRETRGLSQVGMMVDKEFLPRFRYINRLRVIVIKVQVHQPSESDRDQGSGTSTV